jgi:hypothetical protein
MSPWSTQQRDQEKLATSNVEAAVSAANSRNPARRSTTRRASSGGSLSSARATADANGSTAVTCARPIGVVPGQASIAAADLEDPASIDIDEIEQRPDLVLLGIDPDRHLFDLAFGRYFTLRELSRLTALVRRIAGACVPRTSVRH